MDTSYYAGLRVNGFLKPGDTYPLKARSIAVLTNARLPAYLDREAE